MQSQNVVSGDHLSFTLLFHNKDKTEQNTTKNSLISLHSMQKLIGTAENPVCEGKGKSYSFF